jgi:hypothetical protein
MMGKIFSLDGVVLGVNLVMILLHQIVGHVALLIIVLLRY